MVKHVLKQDRDPHTCLVLYLCWKVPSTTEPRHSQLKPPEAHLQSTLSLGFLASHGGDAVDRQTTGKSQAIGHSIGHAIIEHVIYFTPLFPRLCT